MDPTPIERCGAETPPPIEDLQALYEISQTILQSTDLSLMMDRILDKTLEIGGFELGMIRLLSSTRNSLEPVTSRGYRDPENVKRQLKRTEDPTSQRVIAQVVATMETKIEDLAAMRGMRTFRREGVRTMVTVPLRTPKEVLGVVHLGNRTLREITPQQVRFLDAIGAQAGIAIQKIRLFDAAQRHAKEQEVLTQVAVETSRSLNLEELFNIAADKTVEVTGRRRIDLWLKDVATGKINLVACRGYTESPTVLSRSSAPPSIIEKVFRSGTPLVVNDPAAHSAPVPLTGNHPAAWVPLKAGFKVIGVLAISGDQLNPFSSSEVRLLEAIGNVIGAAFENARVFEHTQRNLARTRVLHEISTAITATLDLQDILNLFLDKIDGVLPYAASNVRLFDSQRGILKAVAWRHIDSNEWAQEPGSGRGLPNLVFQTRAPVTVVDVQNDTRVRNHEFFRAHGWVSYLGIPLVVRDETFGVLSFYTQEPREFTEDEIQFVSTLASQASIAIHNSQLYERIKKQALELEESNAAKDEMLLLTAEQKQELARLNAGLEREVAERGRARAEIAAKNRDLETLLYVTSHDLREPLRAIENFSRLVNDRYHDRLDDKGRDFLRRVILGAQRLNRLLDEILTLSRLQRIGAPSEEVSGETIVMEAVKRLDGKINATNAQITAAVDFGGLHVDRTWATQAIYNLIANALKFTREGELPQIDIAPYQPEGPRSKASGIIVRDRGPGVAPEHAERIFQLFQRAVGREIEGTGAGLAIVRQIAERHGGSAWVQQREGGGSEFIVTFGSDKDSEGVADHGHAADGNPPGRR